MSNNDIIINKYLVIAWTITAFLWGIISCLWVIRLLECI